MHVLFFEPYGLKQKHHERALEVMQRHLDAGDRVTVLGCNAAMTSCKINPHHNLLDCGACISRRRHGLQHLSGDITYRDFPRLTARDEEAIEELAARSLQDVDELKALRFEGFDIGYAVASTFISLSRTPRPDLAEHGSTIVNLIYSSAKVYLSMLNHLGGGEYDRACVHNGRHAHQRAVLRACERLGIEFVAFESGCDQDHFALFENTIPQDISYREARIRETWEQGGEDRREIGGTFYTDRVKGAGGPAKHHFVAYQEANILPTDWDSDRHNIVIYNTSEDEFAAIGDQWNLPFYESQLDGVRRIVASLETRGRSDVHVYLRLHPNLRTLNDPTVSCYYDLESPSVTVIPPESPVSTYAMMRGADAVVTFGSTTGIEAAFWGVPSINLANNFYLNPSVYKPASHDEAMDLMCSELEPLDNEGALMFGYYQKTHGIRHRYYEPDDFFGGKFRGQYVRPSLPWRWIARVSHRAGVRHLARGLGKLHRAWLRRKA